MPTQPVTPSLLDYFADLPDPRIDRCKEHSLTDIIAIAILAMICGADHFTEMEEFEIRKKEVLKGILELKNASQRIPVCLRKRVNLKISMSLIRIHLAC